MLLLGIATCGLPMFAMSSAGSKCGSNLSAVFLQALDSLHLGSSLSLRSLSRPSPGTERCLHPKNVTNLKRQAENGCCQARSRIAGPGHLPCRCIAITAEQLQAELGLVAVFSSVQWCCVPKRSPMSFQVGLFAGAFRHSEIRPVSASRDTGKQEIAWSEHVADLCCRPLLMLSCSSLEFLLLAQSFV